MIAVKNNANDIIKKYEMIDFLDKVAGIFPEMDLLALKHQLENKQEVLIAKRGKWYKLKARIEK